MDSLSGVGKSGSRGRGGKRLLVAAAEWLLVGLGNHPYLPVWEEATGHDLALTFLKNEQQRRASRKGLEQRAEGQGQHSFLGLFGGPWARGSCLLQRLSMVSQEPCPGGWEG